ncbi:restriction endonuclease subunit S [Streptococcus suis]|uniref:restriction endonuclease subunit S n=1 Tax=Streptococcus suis TaxID=1307 RepID=UPI00041E6B42|nr:restriction endonuclease subunit S [Streptococcus suis]
MTKEKSTVPRLRFPGFTDAWKQRKLGEVVDVCSGRDYKHLEAGSVPVYGTGGYMLSVSEALSENVDAIGIGRKGTIDNPYILKAPFWTVDTLFYCLPKQGSILEFSYTIFQNINWRSMDESTGVPSLSKVRINNIKVLTPSLQEQEVIGSFFSDLDQLITLHQRKLDDVKELKKALLQKMFPKGNGNDFPELRFPEFTDAWKQRKLGEVAEKISQKNLDRQYVETFTNSAEFGIISQRDFFEKNISSLDNISGYYIVSPDDFVYNPRISNLAPVGPIKRNKLGRVGVMSPLYTIFRFSDIHLDFVEKYFDTTIWHRYMELNGDSGARSDRFAIKDSVFKGLPIPLPTLPEQEAIGSFFSDLDQLITLHQRQLDHLKLLKKALLQQMFI